MTGHYNQVDNDHNIFQSSSEVEQSAVNRFVGSSPTFGV